MAHRAPRPYANPYLAGVALGCVLLAVYPGAAEAAFGWPEDAAAQCYARGRAAFSPDYFAECLGPERAAGALRLSVGLATNTADVDRAIDVIAGFRM